MKGKCQCCGYYTVENEYDICPVCFWERDDNVSPDCAGGANSICLIEAQKNYRKYGACEENGSQRCVCPVRTKNFPRRKMNIYTFGAYPI